MMKRTAIISIVVTTLLGCNSDDNNTVIKPENRAPIAVPDTASVNIGEEVRIDVLNNDSDPDGDDLSITKADGFTIDGDQLIYQAGSDQLPGEKILVYTISDGKLDASSSVTITLTSKPDSGNLPSNRGDYAGSEACSTCHRGIYDEWKDTRHATVMRKLYTEDNHGIDAPWGTETEPKVFYANGHKYTSFMKGEEYWVTIHDPKDSSKDITTRVDVVGYRTQTNFFTYDQESNSLILLPFVYWTDEDYEQWTNWVEWLWYDDEGNLFPEDELNAHIEFGSYENVCAECHLTGFEIESFKENEFAGMVVDKSNIWETEFATGCENCHGPGASHTQSMSKEDIVNPKDLEGDNKGTECSHCHQSGHPAGYENKLFAEIPYKFNAEDSLSKGQHFNVGDNLFDFYEFNIRDKWPGTDYFKQSKTHPMELAGSKHGQSGMTCTSCHDAHSQKLKHKGDAQCTACHSDKASANHKMMIHDVVGANCVDCHMTWSHRSRDRSRRYDIRAHHFEVIQPQQSLAQYDYINQFTKDDADPENKLTQSWEKVINKGTCYDSWKYPPNTKECTDFDVMPNACSSCHKDEFPAPGKFDDIERNKLLKGQERYQRFLDNSK
ncbi:hypothetical protein SAMN04488540_10844 [Ferrimonas sediminum]|uniref:Cytochrome c-552/4 domain-containing protein n=1 Tax=Ferrimonas sediminum TaxID=718193 RepID=A0A1G8TP96_9GAMM|nr:Ig-like domain-containing protein [Ferrimonas sediminum]SDJ43358.1 hypothetical protein SAMN04488540_10844 [Ferrimonas sediminum]